jgi:hypothetical protein
MKINLQKAANGIKQELNAVGDCHDDYAIGYVAGLDRALEIMYYTSSKLRFGFYHPRKELAWFRIWREYYDSAGEVEFARTIFVIG